MPAPRSLSIALYLVLVLLAPLCLYAGSYLALVQRAEQMWERTGTLDSAGDEYVRGVEYRLGGEFALWFYYPINELDRQLRPEYWQPT